MSVLSSAVTEKSLAPLERRDLSRRRREERRVQGDDGRPGDAARGARRRAWTCHTPVL